jgi:hypothetical protein
VTVFNPFGRTGGAIDLLAARPGVHRAVLVPALALAVVLGSQLPAVAAEPDPAPALRLVAMMEAQLDPAGSGPGADAALRASMDGLAAVDAAASIDAAIAQLQARLASAALGHSAVTGGPDPAAVELAGQAVWELGERIAMLRALWPGSDLAASAAAATDAAPAPAGPLPQPEAAFTDPLTGPWAKQAPDPAAGTPEKVFGAFPVPGLPVVTVPGQ